MSGLSRAIWFWQTIVSPHMAGLAAALARQGCEVVYVAERSMTEDRRSQGWTLPDLGSARLELAPTTGAVHALAKTAPVDSTHICQGIRASGWVREAQRALAARGLRQWVLLETVDDTGCRGILKRLEYRRLFMQRREENQCEQNDLNKSRPNKTDEEDIDVHTARIKRYSNRR
jgi:hypothetical protein